MNARPPTWREPREPGATAHQVPVRYIIAIALFVVFGGIAWVAANNDGSQTANALPGTADDTTTRTTPQEVPADVESPTTTVPTPEEEQVQAQGPPLPDLSGTDFTKITTEFIRFDQWLRAHPDPALVAAIFERNSPAFDHVFHEMESATPVLEQQFQVQSTSVEALRGNRVKVTANVTYDGTQLTEVITLHRQDDESWRAVDRVVK